MLRAAARRGPRTGTRQTVLSLPGRARMCFHTDGVTEARVGSELFGEARLAEALAGLGPRASASELLDRVAEQADRRPDDMAACVLSVTGGDDAPRVLAEELELDREEAASARTEDFLLACGVRSDDVRDVVAEARDAAGSAGSVILRLLLGEGCARGHGAARQPHISAGSAREPPGGCGGVVVNGTRALAPDAEIVLGIASTAMPFARSAEEQAERWLRVLRLHGEVGIALQALGVSEESARAGG